MHQTEDLIFSPTDFVAIVNQVFETAMPRVVIEGEVSNFRVSRGKWVYFDLKDEYASLKCFMTVYQLSLPIEDGLMARVIAQPTLHPLYNFSLTVQTIVPVGEGSIKKSVDVLQAKLASEGIFDESRKRNIPFCPEKIALITSKEAAAYGDFLKVATERWGLANIEHHEVHVQGDVAASEIITAIANCNAAADPAEVIVITRGGGSADDLIAFQDEKLVRAIAASRIPTVVAVGHERDVTLSELAADLRASTPSNAAELVVPSRVSEYQWLQISQDTLLESVLRSMDAETSRISSIEQQITHHIESMLAREQNWLMLSSDVLQAYNPQQVLRRGYALLRHNNQLISSVGDMVVGESIQITLHDGYAGAEITEVSYTKS